jgi:hypothetical protein
LAALDAAEELVRLKHDCTYEPDDGVIENGRRDAKIATAPSIADVVHPVLKPLAASVLTSLAHGHPSRAQTGST